jgi:hypothetical protein
MAKKIGHPFGLFLGVGLLLGLLGSPGCSDSQDYSSAPKAKATKDDIQKTEFERDSAARADKPARKAR